MIKITVITGGSEKSSLFSDTCVIIGDPDSENQKPANFFPISGKGLKGEHVKVLFDQNTFSFQNLVNDPFVTLNGQPFFKKRGESGARLRIKDIELLIEQADEDSLNKKNELQDSDTKNPAPPFVEPETTPAAFERKASFDKIFLEKASIATIKEALPDTSIKESFFKDIPDSDDDLHDNEEVILTARIKPKNRPSLKDSDLSEKEQTSQDEGVSWATHLNVSPFRHVRLFSFFMMVFFLVLSVVAVESYLRAGEKSDEEELKAAESLSDIAMALTYAQFYHIAPQKHNWSDPEFIQNNLLATLPTGSDSGSVLNAQGEFSGGHYILRVYTSNDLSRFLIVAHPTPTLLQWLIPKSALIVDSNSMELRRIRDLKMLNRLLANLNTLDGINSSQISDLVKRGEIIPLAYIAKLAKKPEFQPPRALAFLRPGAENLIYNAPRYHHFGDALLKKASHFASIHTSSHELSMLQSELEMLKKFPNLVLYTTDSLDEAKSAIQALKKIGPHEKHMLATIKYDQSGRFSSTKIIMDLEKKVSPLTKKVELPYVAENSVFDIGPEFSTFDLIPDEKFHVIEPIAVIEPKAKTPEPLEPADPVENTKTPLDIKIDEIETYYSNALLELDMKAAEAAKDYLVHPRRKKLLATLKNLLLEKKGIEEQVKEDLFDLSFDFDEADPINASTEFKEKLIKAHLDDLWRQAFPQPTIKPQPTEKTP